ncbi:MAG: adenosylcobinamide-GDP ribazoletransferase [Geminicoccaceae bacterium]
MASFRDFLIAGQFLTRLPVPAAWQTDWTMEDLRDSVLMFPLVGLLVGLLGSLVYAVAISCSLPPVLAAVLAVAALVLVTGGLHEDGLADVADGFGGGRTREQKLDIMRDSRLGSYGAIGLMLSLAFRTGAIAHLAAAEEVAAALLASAALSRAAMPAAMLLSAPARRDGLAASAGRPDRVQAFLGIALAVLVSFLALPFGAVVVAVALCGVVAWAFLRLAQRQIGGITGDVLGGMQQILEIACLAAIVAWTVDRPI